MPVIPGGLAEQLGFTGESVNPDTADLSEISEEEAADVITNPRLARKEGGWRDALPYYA